MAQFITPVITVFDQKRNIDPEGNKKVYEFLVKGGMDGLLVLGSTGEFYSLDQKQQKEIIVLATETVKGRAKVYVGTGGMQVEQTISLSNYALDCGADAVVVISPYYFPLVPETAERYYAQILAGVRGKVYIYNFPDRTGYSICPKTILSLRRKYENLVGIKDTVTNMEHTRKIITTVVPEYPDFEVFSGFDEFFLHNVASGGAGCIGGLSNALPEFMAKWRDAVKQKEYNTAFAMQKLVDQLMDIYDVNVPFIPSIKKAMILRGLEISEACQEPFAPVSEVQTEQIHSILKRWELGLNRI